MSLLCTRLPKSALYWCSMRARQRRALGGVVRSWVALVPSALTSGLQPGRPARRYAKNSSPAGSRRQNFPFPTNLAVLRRRSRSSGSKEPSGKRRKVRRSKHVCMGKSPDQHAPAFDSGPRTGARISKVKTFPGSWHSRSNAVPSVSLYFHSTPAPCVPLAQCAKNNLQNGCRHFAECRGQAW